MTDSTSLKIIKYLLSVLSLTYACCHSYILKTFVLSFHGSNDLDDPSLFDASIKAPIVTLEDKIEVIIFL